MNGRARNQTWLYVFALIGVLFAILIFYRLLTAGLQSYLALIAGTMLVLGNIGDLTRSLQQRLLGVAMLNTLIGLALISYFLGTIVLHLLFWPLSVILLIAAAPLTINRAAVARTYLKGARTLVTQARVLLRARQRTS